MKIFIIEFLISIALACFEWEHFYRLKNSRPAIVRKRLFFNTALRMICIFTWPFALYPYLLFSFLLFVVPKISEIVYAVNLINNVFFLIATPFIVFNSRKLEENRLYGIASQRLFIPLINILIAAVCFNLGN